MFVEKHPQKTIILITFFATLLFVSIGGLGAELGGIDSFFHLQRFTDTAMQIKTGNFSYFQDFFTGNQSGRIVNAIYGPLFAYFEGLIILVANFSGYIWALINTILIIWVGLFSMHRLMKGVGFSQKVSILGAILFTFSTEKFGVVDFLNTGRSGMAAALFPLVILFVVRLVKDARVDVAGGIFVLTLIAQMHMLTLLFAALVIVFAYVYIIVRSIIKRQNIFEFISIGKTIFVGLSVLIINFNVWGGYIEVTRLNHLLFPSETNFLGIPISLSFINLPFFIISFFIFYFIWRKWKQMSLLTHFLSVVFIASALISLGVVGIQWIPGASILQYSGRLIAIALPIGIMLFFSFAEDFQEQLQNKIFFSIVALAFLSTFQIISINGGNFFDRK